MATFQMDLQDRVALVTGASRGIGAAIALELAKHNCHVVINCLENRSASDVLVADMRASGYHASVEVADVRQHDEVLTMIERVERTVGPISIVINNAGIVRDRVLKKMQPAEWNDVIQTNLTGVFNCCRAVVPGLVSRGEGAIVNISSFVGQKGAFGQTNYAAAKAGIVGFTRALALEVASANVTVNAICPGFIATDMFNALRHDIKEKLISDIPLRRVGLPSEVAALVRFVVQEGSYITGQCLNINGGVFTG